MNGNTSGPSTGYQEDAIVMDHDSDKVELWVGGELRGEETNGGAPRFAPSWTVSG